MIAAARRSEIMRFVNIAAVKAIFGRKLNITLFPTVFVTIWTKPGKRNFSELGLKELRSSRFLRIE
jgi:hypothetical protein